MIIFGIIGQKNCGKTGLVERLVLHFVQSGLRVSTIKHAHSSADVDRAGTDSHRHRMAGAGQTILASRERWALMSELRGAEPPALSELIAHLDPCDILLIEGYKISGHPKIEAYRGEAAPGPLDPTVPGTRAIACDIALPSGPLPVFALDDTGAIADFILEHGHD